MKPLIAIITAGGKGLRFSDRLKKQYYNIDGKPLLHYTIKAFSEHTLVSDTIIVLPPEDLSENNSPLRSNLSSAERIHFIAGGDTRTGSVFNGIDVAMEYPQELVLIHDAVRPFIRHSLISELHAKIGEKAGIIPVLDLYDTTIELKDGKVFSYHDRDALKAVQTPQLFKKNILHDVIKRSMTAEKIFTDESGMLNHYNYEVGFINGEYMNIKITVQDQLKLIHQLHRLFYKEGYYRK